MAKVVRSQAMARKLIKRGYQVMDIKPDRLDKTGQRTVFIFDDTEVDLDKVMAEIKEEE